MASPSPIAEASSPTTPSLSGSCLCGLNTYTISPLPAPQLQAVVCHCTHCKKWSGSALMANVLVPRSALKLISRSDGGKKINISISHSNSNSDGDKHISARPGTSSNSGTTDNDPGPSTCDPSLAVYAVPDTDSGRALHRHFCRVCGSGLFVSAPWHPGSVSVMSGGLDVDWEGGAGEKAGLGLKEGEVEAKGQGEGEGRLLGLQELLRPKVEFYRKRKAGWLEVCGVEDRREGQD